MQLKLLPYLNHSPAPGLHIRTRCLNPRYLHIAQAKAVQFLTPSQQTLRGCMPGIGAFASQTRTTHIIRERPGNPGAGAPVFKQPAIAAAQPDRGLAGMAATIPGNGRHLAATHAGMINGAGGAGWNLSMEMSKRGSA
ncbi:putative uncharacterized protein [Pseudomonas sp. StFLB209]|nr:putative uncharacterized protein [Pseudomonas sp. StFLB209]